MTSDPTVRAVFEDWMLESGRALPSPRAVLGKSGGWNGYYGHGGWGRNDGDGGDEGRGDGGHGVYGGRHFGHGVYGGYPSIWRRHD
jgi:hypothetical protein